MSKFYNERVFRFIVMETIQEQIAQVYKSAA